MCSLAFFFIWKLMKEKNMMAYGLVHLFSICRKNNCVKFWKCIKSGCDNKQASGSSYCYLYKPYTGSGKSHSSPSYSNKSSGSTSKSSISNSGSSSSYSNKSNSTNKPSYSSGTKKSATTKKSTYDSYDDGYDDIYMDGDYDYDRYDRDSDYADGVDDAMDEYGEDW